MGEFQEINISIFNMIITASYAAAIIILVRIFSRKAPKMVFWAIVVAVMATAVVFIVLANPKQEQAVANSDTSLESDIVSSAAVNSQIDACLAVIVSSPQTSSNPYDYISAHQNEYQSILKMGDEALAYLLSQFEKGGNDDLKGYVMMALCQELLGDRNNVTDKALPPQEWYEQLSIREEVMLPNFAYNGQDPIEKLVYATEVERNSDSNRGGFTVVAPRIFGSYGDGDLLKVFVTTFSARYKLYANRLSLAGGSVVPAAITYRQDNSGGYILEKYEQAGDGSGFAPSIRKFCTMPGSGKKIKELADEILQHYGDYEDIRILQYDNLLQHLKQNRIQDAVLINSQGEVEFTMRNPGNEP